MEVCCEVREVHARQRRVLQVVLWINAVMFIVELAAALIAHSTALLADSLDMLGDALVYGFSLYVIGRAHFWQARAALLKGVIMAGFGVGVLIEASTKLARGLTPEPGIMSTVALVALLANAAVLLFLWRHRADDINMRSAYVCSRNDVIANAGVLAAALGVAVTGSAWPDILVGLAIASLVGLSALVVIRQALAVSSTSR
ncbi:MAG: cation transporter [Candidatus Rokuibacteriota bacterium]